MRTGSGPRALRDWLATSGAKVTDVATALEKSAPAIYSWLKEEYRPDREIAERLETFTGGAVPADSWLTNDERRARSAVRPFTPPTTGTDKG